MCEDEVTVTSQRHVSAERANKQKRKDSSKRRIGRRREGRWFVFKKPRCDTSEGCDIEETVTSSEELYVHAQAERAKKQKREEKAASSGGAEKDSEPEDGACLERGGVY